MMDSEVKLPLVQQTAPERIWLAVSDEPHNAGERFPEPHEDLCWSDDEPLAVCVPYVRADLAQPTRDAVGVDDLLAAVAKYEDALDMMFDGPDDSDEGYARARWNEARELLRNNPALTAALTGDPR